MPRIEFHLPGDAGPDLPDKAAEVTVTDIGLHENPQPAVLALDFVGADHALDVRELAELHGGAGRSGNRQFTKLFDVVAVGLLQPYLERPAFAPLERGCQP